MVCSILWYAVRATASLTATKLEISPISQATVGLFSFTAFEDAAVERRPLFVHYQCLASLLQLVCELACIVRAPPVCRTRLAPESHHTDRTRSQTLTLLQRSPIHQQHITRWPPYTLPVTNRLPHPIESAQPQADPICVYMPPLTVFSSSTHVLQRTFRANVVMLLSYVSHHTSSIHEFHAILRLFEQSTSVRSPISL